MLNSYAAARAQGIRWARPHLEALCDIIRQALESWAGETRNDAPDLDQARAAAKQLHHTLATLEVHADTALAANIVSALNALGEKPDLQAANIILEAIAMLPGDLERLETGAPDIIEIWQPMLERLQAIAGTDDNNPIVRDALSDPSLSWLDADPASEPRINHQELHRSYQRALRDWLNNSELNDGLLSIAEDLRQQSSTSLRRLGQVAEVTFKALSRLPKETAKAFLPALSRIDHMLNQAEPVHEADAIARTLLHILAKTAAEHGEVQALFDQHKQQRASAEAAFTDYTEDELLLAQRILSGRNRALFTAVAEAAQGELNQAKNTLNELLLGRADPNIDLEQIANWLISVAESLNMLSLERLGERVAAQAKRLAEVAPDDAEDPILQAIAHEILLVESELEESVLYLGQPPSDVLTEGEHSNLPKAEHRRVMRQLVHEALDNLNQAKHQLDQHHRGQGDDAGAQQASLVLRHTANALHMAELDSAAELLKASAGWIESHLVQANYDAIDRDQLESLAEALTVTEFYLDSLNRLDQRGVDYLDRARAQLIELGYLEHAKINAPPVDSEVRTDAAVDEPPQGDHIDETAASAEIETAPEAIIATGSSTGSALDDDEFDLEQIFLEEFDEQSGLLLRLYPKWCHALDDTSLLTDIRRSFHTLKGSGRMAGATQIGEFAWAFEQVLNHTLDGKYQPPQISELIGQAIDELSSLRSRFVEDPDAGMPQQAEWLVQQAETIQTTGLMPELKGLDPTLIQLMIKEISEHLLTIEQWVDQSRQQGWPQRISGNLILALHTIKGTLRLAPIGHEADNLQAVENYLQDLRDDEETADDGAIELLADVQTLLGRRLDRLQNQTVADDHFQTTELAERANDLAHMLHQQSTPKPPAAESESAQTEQDAELSQAAAGDESSQATIDESEPASDEVDDTTAATAPDTDHEPADFTETDSLTPAEEPEPVEAETSTEAAQSDDAPELDSAIQIKREAEFEPWPETELGELDAPDAAQTQAIETAESQISASQALTIDYTALDQDLLELFVEEGRERLESADEVLQKWREQPEDATLVTALQRDLHTVKGSARMAGLNAIGQVAHLLEDLLESIADGQQRATNERIDSIETGCDHLHSMIEAVDAREALPQSPGSEALAIEDETVLFDEAVEADLAPITGTIKRHVSSIRMDSARIEELLNSAGEVSIFRSRIEQEIGGFRNHVSEIEQTVVRLRGQLRKLEQETETQILSRHERERELDDSVFDPLEMDRYSTIQQLSRALAESVSDLNSLTDLMDNASRQSETLLMQQARINTELQESLMQARMVSFGTIAPRLRRVVRNAARDAGKRAELQIELNNEGELDRNVLDRMTAPIEHILRNAIAHGLETPQQRNAAGKPETGRILINVEREATELIIRVSDDGAGLDLERIRARALQQDLISEAQADNEDAIAQVIFQPGFSTADEVTELAGRGVGMEVVASETRQIGGRISVHSESAHGTRFEMRIPLSLAVMQAIFVMAGERTFAIPLQAVRGVARIRPQEWHDALNGERRYQYGGEDYPLLELEPQLDLPPAEIEDGNFSLLMIATGDQRAAIRVAEIQGHREIVLKPVGPQIRAIPGVLAGTIMGDGQVVIILDIAPLIERALEQQRLPGVAETAEAAPSQDEAKRTPLVMVVDDSITMRRVTSRILEHHGLEVITARDGVEAVDLLFERVPDLMLLDIEMPRMDGFEVAEHVRDDARLTELPIMMITSRSGDKHREHAKSLGVERYMIKPYQEANLVHNVFDMLGLAQPDEQD
ncbi:MAG: Hpt domain-containing protein [Pseudomonadota bacterium]